MSLVADIFTSTSYIYIYIALNLYLSIIYLPNFVKRALNYYFAINNTYIATCNTLVMHVVFYVNI
jgi:hypothetical protein